MNIETKVSIDNLTVVGVPTIKPSEFLSFLTRLDIVTNYFITSHNPVWHYNILVMGGGYIQITHDSEKEPKVRFEFNPNRLLFEGVEKQYLQILKKIQGADFSRTDIAIDIYGVDLSVFNIYDMASRKIAMYMDSKRNLETLYFGSVKSEEQVRIYNKKVEQKITNDELDWWRVEVQMRKDKAKSILGDYNPFEKIRIVWKNDLSEYDIKEKAMIHYLQNHPDAISELSKNSRTKYKKILANAVEQVDVFIDVEKIFRDEKQKVLVDIYSWLNYTIPAEKDKIRVRPLPSVLTLGEEEKELNWQEVITAMEKWNND